MKILWVSHSAAFHGGAERTIAEAVPPLKERGHDIHLILPTDHDDDALWASLEVGISRIKLRWWMNGGGWRAHPAAASLRFALPAVSAIRSVSREFKPDVVISNSSVVWQGAAAARLEHLPHVWMIQEFGDIDHRMTFQIGPRATFGLINRLSSRIVVHSRAVERRLSQYVDPLKIDVVPLIVDTPPADSDAHDGNLVFVGRITEAKGQEDAVRAIAKLQAAGSAIPLDIVGPLDTDYARSLVNLAAALGVGDLVRFVGATATPQHWFGQAKAALVCSRCEAFGRVTVEAMKCGAPVIGADSCGTAELVDDGVTGLKYPPGDIAALAAAIERMSSDSTLRERMGKAARGWATRTFTNAHFTDGLMESISNARAPLP